MTPELTRSRPRSQRPLCCGHLLGFSGGWLLVRLIVRGWCVRAPVVKSDIEVARWRTAVHMEDNHRDLKDRSLVDRKKLTYDVGYRPEADISHRMNVQTSTLKRDSRDWERLSLPYKALASAPCWLALCFSIAMLWPEGHFLGQLLSITEQGSVNTQANGQLWLVLLILCFAMTIALSGAATFAAILILLTQRHNLPYEVAKAAMMWRAYPPSWFRS